MPNRSNMSKCSVPQCSMPKCSVRCDESRRFAHRLGRRGQHAQAVGCHDGSREDLARSQWVGAVGGCKPRRNENTVRQRGRQCQAVDCEWGPCEEFPRAQ